MKIKVVYFNRKRNPGNYSIESLFEQVRKALPPDVTPVVKEMRHQSRGFIKRLYSMVDAAFSQGDINHITGDIHFVALFLKKKRTVLTIHDLGFIQNAGGAARFILKWFWILLPVRRCAIVTVVSNATKSDLMKFIRKQDEPKIRVICNPVKKTFVPFSKVFNKKEPVILQIGTKYNKNISRLIKAIEGVNCKLEIVGRLTDNILAQLVYHRINYSCSENLTEEEMIDKYKNADIVSFVSTNEGFGLPIIEANAVGRVVVTSTISSMPEVAGEAAHFVNPYDVISIRLGFLKVMEDDQYREKLILNGFRNKKRFDESTIANQYAEVYRSLMNKN